jgi:hypothetical protein
MGKNQDPGSRINIPDPQQREKRTVDSGIIRQRTVDSGIRVVT